MTTPIESLHNRLVTLEGMIARHRDGYVAGLGKIYNLPVQSEMRYLDETVGEVREAFDALRESLQSIAK